MSLIEDLEVISQPYYFVTICLFWYEGRNFILFLLRLSILVILQGEWARLEYLVMHFTFPLKDFNPV